MPLQKSDHVTWINAWASQNPIKWGRDKKIIVITVSKKKEGPGLQNIFKRSLSSPIPVQTATGNVLFGHGLSGEGASIHPLIQFRDYADSLPPRVGLGASKPANAPTAADPIAKNMSGTLISEVPVCTTDR